MDDFNNMGGDLNVKADINVVDAPTAQNVVMDAPDPFAEPVAPVTEPGTVAFEPQADVFEADPVTEVLPPAETGIPAAEAVTIKALKISAPNSHIFVMHLRCQFIM